MFFCFAVRYSQQFLVELVQGREEREGRWLSMFGWLCIFYGTAKFRNCLKNCIQIWLLKSIEENSCLTTIEKYFQLLQVFLTRKVLCEFFVGLLVC